MIKTTIQKRNYDTDKIKEGKVRVGWWADVKYEDGVSVAQVARWNEFGTPYIPKRQFFRPVVHGQRTELVQELRKLYTDALIDNKNTLNALKVFGEDVIGRVKVSIQQVTTPANAPITVHGGWLRRKGHKAVYIEGKGFNKPLYDSGLMLNSVSYEVEEVKAK